MLPSRTGATDSSAITVMPAATGARAKSPAPEAGHVDPDATAEANGLTFACRTWGDAGETVLALHGFPDAPATFGPLADRLTGAGYRVVAPAMRGYRPTDRAPDGDYSARALGRDAVALGRAVDADYLLGHDWGAVAAYAAARAAPDAFDRFCAMAVPPAFHALVWRHPRQFLRSWYVWTFQLPGAERLLAARDHALVRLLWRTWGPVDPPPGHLDAVAGAIRGREGDVLAYYRQLVRPVLADTLRSGPATVSADIETPALVLAGKRDGCIGHEVFDDASAALAGRHRVVKIRDAGHFLHLRRPGVVAEEVASFFA
jgi:pimeloyl-ACP methyl ester carboxylesterase